MYSVAPEYAVVVGKDGVASDVVVMMVSGGAVVMMVSGGQVEALSAA